VVTSTEYRSTVQEEAKTGPPVLLVRPPPACGFVGLHGVTTRARACGGGAGGRRGSGGGGARGGRC